MKSHAAAKGGMVPVHSQPCTLRVRRQGFPAALKTGSVFKWFGYISAVLDNRAGKLQDAGKDPNVRIFEGGENAYACFALGMLSLRGKAVLNHVEAMLRVEEDSDESRDMREVFARHQGRSFNSWWRRVRRKGNARAEGGEAKNIFSHRSHPVESSPQNQHPAVRKEKKATPPYGGVLR